MKNITAKIKLTSLLLLSTMIGIARTTISTNANYDVVGGQEISSNETELAPELTGSTYDEISESWTISGAFFPGDADVYPKEICVQYSEIANFRTIYSTSEVIKTFNVSTSSGSDNLSHSVTALELDNNCLFARFYEKNSGEFSESVLLSEASESIHDEIIDPNFLSALLAAGDTYDKNEDGIITKCEAENVYKIEIKASEISDFTGIACFSNLYILSHYSNLHLVNLDMSDNHNLSQLFLQNNVNLSSVNVEGLTQLRNISLNYLPSLPSIDLSTNTSLMIVQARDMSFPCIDLTNNLNLTTINVYNVNAYPTDYELNVCVPPNTTASDYSTLGNVNISNNCAVDGCVRCNVPVSLISNFTLDCDNNLSVELFSNTGTTCSDNLTLAVYGKESGESNYSNSSLIERTVTPVSGVNLVEVFSTITLNESYDYKVVATSTLHGIVDEQEISINEAELAPKLTGSIFDETSESWTISGAFFPGNGDVCTKEICVQYSEIANFRTIYSTSEVIKTFNVSTSSGLDNLSHSVTALELDNNCLFARFYEKNSGEFSESVLLSEASESIHDEIIDPNFLSALLAAGDTYDKNEDGVITKCEAENVYRIAIKANEISDFTGIACFSNLYVLIHYSNSHLVNLDMSDNHNLSHLFLQNNVNLSSVNVEGLTRLREISLNYLPSLPSIDLSTNTSLMIVQARDMSFPCIDLTNNLNLTTINVYNVNAYPTVYELNACVPPNTTASDYSTLGNVNISNNCAVDGCSSSISREAASFETETEVYPVPFQDELNISLENGSYSIYDVSGNLIKEGVTSHLTTLNTSELSAGRYTIKLVSGDAVEVKSIIKN